MKYLKSLTIFTVAGFVILLGVANIKTAWAATFSDDFTDGIYIDKWSPLQESNPPSPINVVILSETNGVLQYVNNLEIPAYSQSDFISSLSGDTVHIHFGVGGDGYG